MKKLMMAVAIVCAAVGVQAATATWNVEMSTITPLYKANSSSTIGGTMYLFYAEEGLQETVVNAWLGGKDLASIESSKRVAQAFTVTSAGTVAKTSFTGPDAAQDYFVAILASDGNLFVGDDETGSYDAITGGALALDESWSGDGDYDFREAKAYDENGWYAQSVPEPTSGLLLLLGMAGLALRRKRS